MGDVAKQFSTLSWVGKVRDDPKPYGLAPLGKGPITDEDLADFELKLLKMIYEMVQKTSAEQAERDKE